MKILACDVSKSVLVFFDGSLVPDVENEAGAIEKQLKAHPDYVLVCEPTSSYHFLLVETAVRLGHTVYLVNPKEARNYKDSLSFRAKTDPLDARYLYEYVLRNSDLLKPFKPATPELLKLRKLLSDRQVAVESRTTLSQSFGPDRTFVHESVLDGLTSLIRHLEKEMEVLLRKFRSYKIVRSIPGVGLVSAAALVFVLETKGFASANSLIAFLGLDVRVRQSGRYKGQGKITKRGDSLFRFLLCFAGRGLLNSRFGKKKRAELIAKKRYFPERLVIAARKILRTAFHLLHKDELFQEEKWTWPL